jgi:hypothetical protein
MSQIKLVDMLSLGYREIRRDYPGNNSNFIKEKIKTKYYNYNFYTESNRDWIIANKRIEGNNKPEYYKMVKIIDKANFSESTTYDFLNEYYKSGYYSENKKLFKFLNYEEISKEFETLKSRSISRRYYMYSLLSMLIGPDHIQRYLIEKLLPVFF